MGRILVVDDDDTIRLLLEAHLKQLGHGVVLTSSAAEALAVVADRGVPDVAVLDVNLPDIDGFALAERLRCAAQGQQLPVIFLSASVDEAHIDEGRRTGAVYLTKPYIRNALRHAIDKALAQTTTGW